MPIPSLLNIVVEIAEEAGRKIIDLRNDGLASKSLSDKQNPVTAADLAAEKYIKDRLNLLDPKTPIVSEESKTHPSTISASRLRYWLVDPLDGTKDFLAGTDEFTINIALMENGRPVLGVIHAPAQHQTYFAYHGKGAWKRSSLEPKIPATRIYSKIFRPTDVGPRILCSRSHPEPELENWLRSFREPILIQMGSSLKFAYLADGKADIYPRFRSLFEWDVAAGDCIFRESGHLKARTSNISYDDKSVLHPRRVSPFILGIETDSATP